MASKCQYFFSPAFFILAIWAHLGLGRNLVPSAMSEMHEQWMAQHGRAYKDAQEKEQRFKIFKEKVEFIESFNNAGDKPYKLRVNKFSDLTTEEFSAFRYGLRPSNATGATPFMYANVSEVPTTVDWRKKGAVTPIKDQGRCGCCWAFSAVAAVEGITKLTTGNLISLSEQEVVDCDTNGKNMGCSGGLPSQAFEFIQQNQGLTTEETYPYNGVDGTCAMENSSDSTAQISGYENVPPNSEDALLKAVANQPVSVCIEASGESFMSYGSGVYSGDDCGTNLNHAVTIVGYGTADDGTNYWLAKNSWGTSWGENGYIRMQRDVGDQGVCGIAMVASYPTATAN